MIDGTMIIVFCIVLAIMFLIRARKRNLPPGPMRIPIIGNRHVLGKFEQPFRKHIRLAQTYGDVFSFKMGKQEHIVLHGYDAIYEAFVKKGDVFSGRPKQLHMVQEMTKGKGILMQDGEPWKALRRFTLTTLRDFGLGKNFIEERILDETKYVMSKFDETLNEPQDNLRPILGMATSNIINAFIFGSRFEYTDPTFLKVMEALDTASKATVIFSLVDVMPILRFIPSINKEVNGMLDADKQLRDFAISQIKQHKETFDESNIRDYVDVYIKMTHDQKETVAFTEEDMFRAIVEMFEAGSETTATTMNWAVLYMIAFPEIQKRCQEEIDHVIGRSRMIRQTDRKSLPYVDATLLEISRIASIVPIGLPHCATEDTTFRGYDVPAGTMITGVLYSALHDPRHWQCPESFRPERFLDENGKVTKVDALIPFSTGPRVCLGESLAKAELFLFFANFLQQYTFHKANDADILSFEGHGAITRSPTPYNVRISKR